MNIWNKYINLQLFIFCIFTIPIPSYSQKTDVSGKTRQGIEIESMKYGSRPENMVPVTNKTMEMLRNEEKITISKAIVASDPAPGEKKYAELVISVDGSRSVLKILDGETFDIGFIQKRFGKLADQKTDATTKVSIKDSKTASDKTQKQEKAGPGEFRSSVNQAVDLVSKAIDSKVDGIQMLAYSKAFKSISDYPEVEKIMGIDNEWYLNISKMLAEMGKYKMEMEISKERDLTARFETAKNSYAVLAPKFKQLIEHPVKVSKK